MDFVDPEPPRAPGLYTYYAMMSLLVVVLAVSLLWIPFLQLITEMNTIIAKVVIYLNTELLGCKNCFLTNTLETIFLSENSLIVMSALCVIYALYLASTNFLLFAGCCIYNLPNTKYLKNLRKLALEVIEYLLNLTGKNKVVEDLTENYHNLHA